MHVRTWLEVVEGDDLVTEADILDAYEILKRLRTEITPQEGYKLCTIRCAVEPNIEAWGFEVGLHTGNGPNRWLPIKFPFDTIEQASYDVIIETFNQLITKLVDTTEEDLQHETDNGELPAS